MVKKKKSNSINISQTDFAAGGGRKVGRPFSAIECYGRIIARCDSILDVIKRGEDDGGKRVKH